MRAMSLFLLLCSAVSAADPGKPEQLPPPQKKAPADDLSGIYRSAGKEAGKQFFGAVTIRPIGDVLRKIDAG